MVAEFNDLGWLEHESVVNERMRSYDYLRCPTAYANQRRNMKKQEDQRGWSAGIIGHWL